MDMEEKEEDKGGEQWGQEIWQRGSMENMEEDNEVSMDDIKDIIKTSGTWRKTTIWAWRRQKEDSEVSMEEDSPGEKSLKGFPTAVFYTELD